MNPTESRMTELLTEMREKYHVTGVKAEFEAEGTRMNEAIRLKEIAMSAQVGFNLKIGGCEAIRDLYDAVILGAERIIAPMIESSYALHKFLKAADTYLVDQQMELLINLETITACENFDSMLKLSDLSQLNGVVIGRVDLSGSLGLERSQIDTDLKVKSLALEMAAKAKERGLKVVIGGAITTKSLEFLQSFPAGHIDRFETRKVIFNCPDALHNSPIAFTKAAEFEMLWLRNKQKYYSAISQEDQVRLSMIEQRLGFS
ncbi:MAG: aldolase/citrate lyase family protein [Pseudanabaenaceae cyanobacterium bins.39]|nr:aldolase/citrate lyase family protein [Pseudanabaenaceae cyanobacterium bins.39]